MQLARRQSGVIDAFLNQARVPRRSSAKAGESASCCKTHPCNPRNQRLIPPLPSKNQIKTNHGTHGSHRNRVALRSSQHSRTANPVPANSPLPCIQCLPWFILCFRGNSPTPHLCHPRNPRSNSAFTRLDLIIVILILSVLGGVLYAFGINTDARRNLQTCTANLERLGDGFTKYIADHHGALPYASIQTNGGSRATWDLALRHYLTDGALSTNTPFSLEARAAGQELAKFFRCPADTIPRDQGNRPRSYAMPMHRPHFKSWPPSADSETGVGLHLVIRHNDEGRLMLPKWRAKTETNRLTVITTDIITAPADTLLLTEKADSKNQLYNAGMNPLIKSTAEHLDTNQLATADYHAGRFNYLMIDGHVETLLPEQTVGWSGSTGTNSNRHKGIWTIKAGD